MSAAPWPWRALVAHQAMRSPSLLAPASPGKGGREQAGRRIWLADWLGQLVA